MFNNIYFKHLTIIPLLIFVTVLTCSSEERLDFTNDFEYVGAFRLPDVNTTYNWEHSGRTLAFNPMGDSNGEADGYLGSLYSVNYKNRISQFTIPKPILSENLNNLNTATTLSPFYDVTEGKLWETLSEAQNNQLRGLTYLSPQGSQTEGKLYWTFWSSYNVADINYPSHGYSNLDESSPNAQGPWNVQNYHSMEVGGYLFEIPIDWANKYLNGKNIASGVVREGGTYARGPVLIATAPYQYSDNSPPPNKELESVALIYYDTTYNNYPDYVENDGWGGGAWITTGDKAAVIFVGSKCMGLSCYGDNTKCYDPCDNDKGYHCYPRQPQMIFYDTNDLADVAQGLKKPWDIKPYQIINLLEHLSYFKECTAIPGVTYDRNSNLLYILQYKGDDSKPLVHVFRIKSAEASAPPSAPQGLIIKES
ncbi:MAG: hypothetical protein HUN04_14025 [Desulfobacter sp.]|nr:MAG: hypothetical protein HUN04_14025 [Desulfobacter sp.]